MRCKGSRSNHAFETNTCQTTLEKPYDKSSKNIFIVLKERSYEEVQKNNDKKADLLSADRHSAKSSRIDEE
jgi:hypothetical protein